MLFQWEESSLGFECAARIVPENRLLSEIRFVRHVAGDGSVIAEDCVFHHRLARPYAIEKSLQVRAHVVPVVAVIGGLFMDGFLAQLGIMLGMPLLEIFFAHLCGITVCIVARVRINSGLRRIFRSNSPASRTPFG